MVEIQSCATLVNASAFCSIEQEVKGETENNVVVDEISAELQRERQKNAELLRRISVLEAQIRERNNKEESTLITDTEQGNYQHPEARNLKRFKRRKLEMEADAEDKENRDSVKSESRLVNWMSIDETQNFHLERFKDSDSVADFGETDSDDECDDHYDDDDNMGNGHNRHGETDVRQEKHELQKVNETGESGSVSVSQHRKPLKVAFCPKEVKRIVECEALSQKNAQSHTIRKIIVFASLGIRHGCEDMYELDFNHFSIVKKGEHNVSPRNPGEYVLYENPGVRRKIFYPNRENPILCPIQILEEERAMRPSDATCPSCLFLCIKYGGRTRNLPQNEYVRQRMGRNKLKSFGPLMCKMAMLVHIRSGSFFFKALGITLLFMAGFPDDLVQRETKYRNLDLLQKYYRTDEDAAEEELFLSHPIACDNGTPELENSTRKSLSAKPRGRKPTNSINKSQNLQKTPSSQSPPATSSPSQFALTSYSTSHTLAMAAPPFHSTAPPQISQDTSQMPHHHHASYHMLPPQQTSAYVPLLYWPPPPNAFPYGYQSFPSAPSYISFHAESNYYNHHSTSSSSVGKLLESSGKNDYVSDESDSDSDSSDSGDTLLKQREAVCK